MVANPKESNPIHTSLDSTKKYIDIQDMEPIVVNKRRKKSLRPALSATPLSNGDKTAITTYEIVTVNVYRLPLLISRPKSLTTSADTEVK